MPRRWGINTRLWVYRYLCLRDGEFCAVCHRTPNETAQNTLDIDHCDGNKDNNDPHNLRLLCRRCNVQSERAGTPFLSPESDKEERENQATRIVREVVNYRDGSPEMQASYLFELDFRDWLIKQIREKGAITKKEAIFAGAETVGCSPTTTQKYLGKLTSAAGLLTERRDMLGDTLLILKNGHHNGDWQAAELHRANQEYKSAGGET